MADADLSETKVQALSSFSPQHRRALPRRFLQFMKTPQCDKFLQRAMEFVRVSFRMQRLQRKHPGDHSQGQRTVAREYESVTRLISEEYVKLVRANSWSGRANERANRADAKYFEALLHLTDAVVQQSLRGSCEPGMLELGLRDLNRLFRSNNFNSRLHHEQRSRSCPVLRWEHLPDQVAPTKRMLLQQFRAVDRPMGIVQAIGKRSPLVSVRYPSLSDKLKNYNAELQHAHRAQQGLPVIPPRCSPTKQCCIIGRCPECTPLRKEAISRRHTARVAFKMNPPPRTAIAPMNDETRKWLRGLRFDAAGLGRDVAVDLSVLMIQDLGVFDALDISEDTFTSFLIDVRAQHPRLKFTNWSHSVGVAQRLYYLISTGGAAAWFSPYEVLAMFMSALCSGANFPGNDPVVVTSANELWMLQRTGSAYLDHYHDHLPKTIMALAQQPHCNFIGKLELTSVLTLRKCVYAAVQGFDLLTMSLLLEQIDKQLGGTPDDHKDPSEEVAFKDSDEWHKSVNYELMQLMMMASWTFYPGIESPGAKHAMRRFSKELITEGDKIAAQLQPGVNRADVVASCQDRKVLDKPGAEERVHAMFVELIVQPLYRVLKSKLGHHGHLDPIISQIEAFRAELHAVAHEFSSNEEQDGSNKDANMPASTSGFLPSINKSVGVYETTLQ